MSESAETFFDVLFGDLQAGECIDIRFIYPDRDHATLTKWADGPDDGVSVALHPPPGYGSFVGVLPRTRRGGRSAGNVARVTVVWADIDSYKDGKNKAAVVRRLKDLKTAPTMIVDSGGGIHAYWKLNEDAPPRDAKRLMQRIAQVLEGDRSVAEVARVLRVPGTVNRKEKVPRPVVLLSVNRLNVYSFAQLCETFPEEAPLPPPTENQIDQPVLLGRRTQQFFEDGILPDDGQTERSHLLGISRNLHSNGWDVDEAVAAVWQGIQKHGNAREEDPWTQEDITKVVKTIYASEPTVDLRPQEPLKIVPVYTHTTGRLVPIAADEMDAPLEPPAYVVDGYLIEKDVVSFTGVYGGGKSWIALDLALAVADEQRQKWLGQAVSEHGVVLHFDEENTRELILERLHLLGARKELLGRRLYIFPWAGVLLDQEDWVAEVHALVDLTRPALCIFDSFARFHTGNENDVGEMSRLYRTAYSPISRMYGAAVVTLDHPTKANLEGSARGSIDKMAVLDRGWHLKVTGDDRGLFSHNKVRRGIKPKDIVVIRQETIAGIELVAVPKEGPSRSDEDVVLEALVAADGALSQRDLSRITGLPRTTLQRILPTLDDRVQRTEDGWEWTRQKGGYLRPVPSL